MSSRNKKQKHDSRHGRKHSSRDNYRDKHSNRDRNRSDKYNKHNRGGTSHRNMSEDKLAQLLAMGASTALLQGGVDGRVEHQSHYPFEEHPALLQKKGTRTTSQLTAMLDFRKMNNIHDPTKEEKALAEYIKNAKSFL